MLILSEVRNNGEYACVTLKDILQIAKYYKYKQNLIIKKIYIANFFRLKKYVINCVYFRKSK